MAEVRPLCPPASWSRSSRRRRRSSGARLADVLRSEKEFYVNVPKTNKLLLFSHADRWPPKPFAGRKFCSQTSASGSCAPENEPPICSDLQQRVSRGVLTHEKLHFALTQRLYNTILFGLSRGQVASRPLLQDETPNLQPRFPFWPFGFCGKRRYRAFRLRKGACLYKIRGR